MVKIRVRVWIGVIYIKKNSGSPNVSYVAKVEKGLDSKSGG